MRFAVEADRDLLVAWLRAFQAEAMPPGSPEDTTSRVDDAFRGQGRDFLLWDVRGRPASLAGAGGETPHGRRIGPVYTPPELRRRGYASALTAAVSQLILDSGKRFCFLYTDLANPTSNKIYQEIGYEPVTDALMIRFVT